MNEERTGKCSRQVEHLKLVQINCIFLDHVRMLYLHCILQFEFSIFNEMGRNKTRSNRLTIVSTVQEKEQTEHLLIVIANFHEVKPSHRRQFLYEGSSNLLSDNTDETDDIHSDKHRVSFIK